MDRQGKRKRPSTPDSDLHLPKRQSVTLSDTDQQQSSAPSSAFYPSQLHPTGQALLTSDGSLHGWHSGPYLVAPGVAPMSSDASYQATSYKGMIEPHWPSSSHPHPHTSASSPQVSPQSLQAYDNSPLDWYNGPYLVSPGVAPTFGDLYQAPSQSNGTTLLGPSYSRLYPYTTASSPQTLVSPPHLGAARLVGHDCPNGLKPVSPGVAPAFGSSGGCYQMPFQSSATALPGSSYSRLHPYASVSSPQVHPAGPQPPQISGLDNITHGYGSVGSSLRVDEAAPASGSPGDPWPFPIPVLELPESESQLHDLVSSLEIYHASSQNASASSPQVYPAGPQPPQISGLDNIPFGSVGSSLGADGAAPAFVPSGDPWPFPISVLELPEISNSDSQSRALISSLEIYPTSSQPPCEGSHRDQCDGLMESHPEISRNVAPWSPSGSLQSIAPDMRTWRSNVNSVSRSSTSVPGLSVTTTPAHSSPAHSDRLPSPSPTPSGSEAHCDTPNPWGPYDNNARVRTQLENAGMSLPVPLVSERTPSSSAGPSDGKKENIISATRAILQTASSAFKFSPVPFLPNIPDSLLTLLQVYENISSNNKALKGLNDVVQCAFNTMLRPLQLWTGPIPPEVTSLMEELHLALEDQVKMIKSLQSQNRNLFKKIFNAGPLAQSITDVRTCISVALSRFATAATTLNLLNTIQASVDYELSKLPKVDAEYYRVKSKSECLETTRDTIRGSILEYLRDPQNRFVSLRGSPGTGKTAISMSVASTLDKQHTLAASFFWDKNQEGTGLDSIERFPSTLSRQLAAFNPEYKSLLIRQLREPASFSSIGGSAAEKEVKAWIVNPMRELGGVLSSGKGRPVIVLDGLDECGTPEVLASLMRLVLLLDELPSTFAVLVSCRPEPQVISAWARANPHLSIAHEDMDQIAEDEKFHTIRCMVVNGLQDCITESPWKPTKKDLDMFSSACRGLPIIASTRIRDVLVQIEGGSVLKTEFNYYRDLIDAPKDLNSEYLRIMRRAYLRQRPQIDPHIAEKYREVIRMMIVPRWFLGVYGISRLLGMFSEHEVRSILKPISSIIDLPSTNKKPVKFYHATVKEFITGIPIGKEEDEVFFISDEKGYSIGLRLLRFVNGAIKRNKLGLPTELPLGDVKNRRGGRTSWKPKHVDYALAYLFEHLDPSLLFSRKSNKLQREFGQFWTQNLLSFFTADGRVPPDWGQLKNHKSISVIRDAQGLFSQYTPRDAYRSVLPFTPTSSPVYKYYGHLSDPVRVFSVSGEFSGGLIPLSDDAHRARRAMEAELPTLPKKNGGQETNYEAEFLNDSVRNGIVTCAALSRDGHRVAFGFRSGIIEVADIDNQHTICRFQSDSSYPPVWIEFIHGSSAHIATEDTQGNTTVFIREMPAVKLGILPSSHHQPLTTVSDNGCFIVRVPRNFKDVWYENTTLLCVSGNPFVRSLAPPSTTQSSRYFSLPSRQSLGFSPGGQYVCAYGAHDAFVWSTYSGDLIGRFCAQGFNKWIINTGVAPLCSYSIPNPMILQSAIPLIPEVVMNCGQTSDSSLSRHDSDESWLKCPFYNLHLEDLEDWTKAYSHAAGSIPLIIRFYHPTRGYDHQIFLNGILKFTFQPPWDYEPIEQKVVPNDVDNPRAWYGDRDIYAEDDWHHKGETSRFYLPQASKDGTRFLIQGKMKAPIIIDISQIVCPPLMSVHNPSFLS